MSAQNVTASLWWDTLIRPWICVPLSIIFMLYCIVGMDSLIGLGTVDFPSSVACLLILFFFLLVCDWLLPSKHMGTLLSVLKVPTEFALRTMNLYFTPSFVLLPTSTLISGEQIGALAGVFIVGLRGETTLPTGSDTVGNPEKTGTSMQQPSVTSPTQNSANSGPSGQQQETDQEYVKEDQSPSQISDPMRESATPSELEQVSATAAEDYNSTEKKRRWRPWLLKNIDRLTWFTLFLVIGLPVYYATGYTMPIFLCINVLCFQGANAVPPKIKRIAHPVLVCALFSILFIWGFSVSRGLTLYRGLNLYKTGTSYMNYLRGASGLPRPGAGDILASLLDASIVSLAMPMYQYRQELRHYFASIFLPVLFLTIPSLFGYPPLCFSLGISATISLAVAPRSVTLALAQLSTQNLGGNTSAISVIAVVSGISGPIFGPTILRMLRIPEKDFVTWGVVLGANSSAIATAMLLERDRRAAALSSLSLSLFGIVFVILTVIPPLATYVRSLVGL
ncbi:hypothetical protein J7T55_002542 [Diaporthe amygdali]|uniref:uncharacterized protein n=1 Tax=Phomopsis amygdali TaxID=1214568 RepID=UPI0022FF024A|nr:uncharacterized protein J7T55_002542 [Diaporthe amygdali]KAJ0122031.1 hypothetical protein J7T55_002542 [Diaporthe amygdali]